MLLLNSNINGGDFMNKNNNELVKYIDLLKSHGFKLKG